MDLTKEELKKLIKDSLREVLAETNEETSSKVDNQAAYQHFFDQTMASVAKGDLTSEEAGKLISKAYDKYFSQPKQASKSVDDLTQQYEDFKAQLNDWEKEMSGWINKEDSESTEDMLNRMKEKASKGIEEAKKLEELKRLNEEAAKAQAELSLKEMKEKLNRK